MVTLLRDRVQAILDDQGINKKALADAAKVTKGNVSHWANGTASTMQYEPAVELHRRYGYSMRWLMRGVGQRYDNDSPDLPQEHEELIALWESLLPKQKEEIRAVMMEMKDQTDTLRDQLAAMVKDPPRQPPYSRRREKSKI